jgi:HJR/Mrr/RecB family endonuclease
MFDAIVTWQRGHDIIQQHILADIQDMDVPEARDLQAKSPTDAFWVFTNYEYDIKKGDILVNEANTSETYRVFARVRKYPGHAEIPVELISDDEQQPVSMHQQDEQKEGSQQRDKGRTSASMKGVVFSKLVHELLLKLGYRVVAEQGRVDTGVDFLASFPITYPDGTTREQVWVVEVKYRNLAGKLGIEALRQIYGYAVMRKASKALLVTNVTLTKDAQIFVVQNNEVEIWDIDKLLALLNRFPELGQKYADVIPQLSTAIDEEELTDKTPDGQHELIRELRRLPTGDGKAYEGVVKRILEFCFHDEFSPFAIKEQVKTLNEKRIRDFIIDNRNSKMQFWKDLKWVRKVEKILFDTKNYKNPVEYREISDTLRYLKNEAFGNFVVIISRHGIKDYEEVIEDYSDKKQVALFLSDDDLVKMINLKIEGESPTYLIEDRYYDFLDKK